LLCPSGMTIPPTDDDDDDDVQWQTDTSAEAARLRIQEQLSAATAEMVMLSTIEANGKSQSPKTASPPRGVSPKVENGNSSHEKLVEEVKAKIQKGVTANQLQSILGSLSGSPQDVMTALFEALFDGVEKGFAKEVAKKKGYLAAAVSGDEGSQLLLLRAIEAFVLKPSLPALKEVAVFLKALYDADVVEEEYIMQWYQEGLASGNKDSQMWKNVRPFIEWLQSAESETEEE